MAFVRLNKRHVMLYISNNLLCGIDWKSQVLLQRSKCLLLSERVPVMPRCEGLPAGPCPRKVNNRTVKLCQGDLMLCQACENVRFPSTTKGESAKSLRSSSTSKVRASSSCDSEGEHPPTYVKVTPVFLLFSVTFAPLRYTATVLE